MRKEKKKNLDESYGNGKKKKDRYSKFEVAG